MVAVRAYLEAVNAGDAQSMSAAFAETGSILHGMAPHLWLGMGKRKAVATHA